MIEIDKKDYLYKYLTSIGSKNVEKEYLELAKMGRFKQKDIQIYFQSTFAPSSTEDIADEDLEKVVDYFSDLKKIKPLNKKQLKEALIEYKKSKDKQIKEAIINTKLKDVLYLCLNYKTLHKDDDIEDLIQDANLGLLDAIKHYDETSKIDFNDYIIYWIRARIAKDKKEN